MVRYGWRRLSQAAELRRRRADPHPARHAAEGRADAAGRRQRRRTMISGSTEPFRAAHKILSLEGLSALRERFPDATAALERGLVELQRAEPPPPRAACFVHGDFGPANLLWRMGQIVVLDGGAVLV